LSGDLRAQQLWIAVDSILLRLECSVDFLFGDRLVCALGIEHRLHGHAASCRLVGKDAFGDERLELLSLQYVDLLLEAVQRRADGRFHRFDRDRFAVDHRHRLAVAWRLGSHGPGNGQQQQGSA
jgi:hypothetical protein